MTTRLLKLGYTQHPFDKLVFLKRNNLNSIIVVYVDDFSGVFRVDYDIGEVHAEPSPGEA